MSTKQNIQVMLVDDSPAMIERLTVRLDEIPGVDVARWAVDVPSAIWALQQEALDAVVLDLQLGEDNALSILAQFRAALRNTKFIIFSNYANPSTRRACLRAGADYFFDKSHEFQELIDLLTCLGAEQGAPQEHSI